MSVEQTPEVLNFVDNALNTLGEGAENTVRIHTFFGGLNEDKTDIAIRLLDSQLLKNS